MPAATAPARSTLRGDPSLVLPDVRDSVSHDSCRSRSIPGCEVDRRPIQIVDAGINILFRVAHCYVLPACCMGTRNAKRHCTANEHDRLRIASAEPTVRPAAVENHEQKWSDTIGPSAIKGGGPLQPMPAFESRAEDVLRAVIEGTASVTGDEFFRSLVKYVASALGVRYAFVTECRQKPMVQDAGVLDR